MHGHGAEAARPQDEARRDHRIAHQRLQVGRHQRQRGEIGDADHEDEDHPDEKLRSRKSGGLHEGILRREGVDEEEVEGRRRDGRLDEDLGRGEPVELLAAVEHELQGADGDAERAEAEPVEARAPARTASPARRALTPRKREHAERHVDVEDPAPVEMFSVSQPPIIGPSTGPTITATPNSAIAEPRSSGG